MTWYIWRLIVRHRKVRSTGHKDLTHDEIDRVLAAHYGFTEEELDFIPST